ncbi:McrC family protein [Burkholderia semiarida]|nr:McrC family protein [Burkholderia semiarida]OXI23555.1 restriction endonuclease [Burkholderia sp. AU16482]
MAYTRTRLSLVEYGKPIDLSYAIAAAIGIERTKASSLLMEAGSRAASSLRLNYNPISVDAKGARAIDFAGLIRLAPSLELEVTPKFLGLDDADSAWREDFFFLSTLSRHGRLLASERLSASGGAPRDLSTLVARSIASMYEARKRRPLRSYRRAREADFFIDGDPDPVDLTFPSPDGFEQELIRLDRRNGWNADIVAAAKELLPEVSDPSAASSLVRLIEDLSPQNAPAHRRKPIPARHRAWNALHELSIDVLGGLGLSYKQGQAHAPGYLVSTWRVWEDLLTVAARLGFGRNAMVAQQGYSLGTKTKIGTGAVSKLSVYPDCVIESDGIRPRMLLDAKYKGHVEQGLLRISEADIYEALAFSRATGCDFVALAYPAQPADAPLPVGTCTVFERVVVGTVQIVGIQLESRLISRTGGLRVFASNMASGIVNALF